MDTILYKMIVDLCWAISMGASATLGVMFTCWAFDWMPVHVSVAVVPQTKENTHD